MFIDKETGLFRELLTLEELAKAGKASGSTDLEHMDSTMSAYNYIRIADSIFQHIKNNHPDFLANHTPVLDWGAGYGQVSWLLKKRGLNVITYNVEERKSTGKPMFEDLDMITGEDPVKLPFEDEAFGAVISCGVLEHVADPNGSLDEIRRVLKKGGNFYLFMLPQKTSWVEKLSEWRGISVHPVKYSVKDTRNILSAHGLAVEKLWRFNLIPKNLTGMPASLKKIYGKLYKYLYPLDRFLSSIPILNLLSGVIEGVAIKK